MKIYSLLNSKFTCQFCGKQHFVPIKKVVTEKGALNSLSEFVSSLVKGKQLLVLSDDITYEVAGKKCAEILNEKYEVTSLVLTPKESKTVQAEEKYLPGIFEQLQGKNAILTVGTGSITDMGKYVAGKLNVPAICFPTAPSMNAYTSEIAALLVKGLKVTLPAKPAIGVLTDLNIISQAPLELIKAGFADSLAKAFANADWKLSSLLTGEDYCPLPLEITTEAESKYIDKGDELLRRNETVISYLMDGLNAGGISMIIAGETSPASGGEHLISHFLDMFAHHENRELFSWHGLQVGLGIMVSARIYERMKNLSARQVEQRLSHRQVDYGKEMASFGKDVFFNEQEFGKKVPFLKELPKKLPLLWDQIKEEVFSLVYSPEQMQEYLGKAKCPLCFEEIGVDKNLTYRTIMNARYIRGRMTILDIADELGILKEIAETAK